MKRWFLFVFVAVLSVSVTRAQEPAENAPPSNETPAAPPAEGETAPAEPAKPAEAAPEETKTAEETPKAEEGTTEPAAPADAPKTEEAAPAEEPKTETPPAEVPAATESPTTDTPRLQEMPATDSPRLQEMPAADSPRLQEVPATDTPKTAEVPPATQSIPTVATNPPPVSTNLFGPNTTMEEMERMVLKPPQSKAPISTMPTLVQEPPPPLSAEAQRHEYLGFQLGMTIEEAKLMAERKEKKLEVVVEKREYFIKGCLTDVPKADKARTILLFRDGKLDILMLLWDVDQRMFIELEPLLVRRYGRPLRADELFRRYWVLENDDCIRMLYQLGGSTSLAYGTKDSIFRMSEDEKKEITKEYEGL